MAQIFQKTNRNLSKSLRHVFSFSIRIQLTSNCYTDSHSLLKHFSNGNLLNVSFVACYFQVTLRVMYVYWKKRYGRKRSTKVSNVYPKAWKDEFHLGISIAQPPRAYLEEAFKVSVKYNKITTAYALFIPSYAVLFYLKKLGIFIFEKFKVLLLAYESSCRENRGRAYIFNIRKRMHLSLWKKVTGTRTALFYNLL
jgi:hypothetical protein